MNLRPVAFGLLLLVASGQATRPAAMRSDIEFARIDGVPLRLDAHVPASPGPHPVVIIVHGGGWSGGDKTQDITPLFEPLAAGEFTWFSINYRLAPEHRWPAQLEDVATAIRWVREHAVEYKGDPGRIAIIGHSAGGQLAMLAAMKEPVRAVVGLAAVSDMEIDLQARGGLSPSLQKLLGRPKEVDAETLRLLQPLQPIKQLRAGFPPTLLLQGTADKTVWPQQAKDFAARGKELQVEVTTHFIEAGQHRVTEWDRYDGGAWKGVLVRWLNDHLSRPGAATRPAH